MCSRLLGCFARNRPSRYGGRGAFFSVLCEGQALALRAPGRVGCFVVRGPSRLYQSDAGFPTSRTLQRGCLYRDRCALLAGLILREAFG